MEKQQWVTKYSFKGSTVKRLVARGSLYHGEPQTYNVSFFQMIINES